MRRALRTWRWIPACAVLGLFLFNGCGAPFSIEIDNNEYTLTVNTSGKGSVSPSGGTYKGGTPVILVATPATNWTFLRWEGDSISVSNRCLITMDCDKTVTAVFQAPQRTLKIETEGQGTVTQDPNSPTYAEESTVTLTANAASGWHFARWTGSTRGSDSPRQIQINGNMTIKATFEEDASQYSLTTEVSGSGSVTPADGNYNAGSQITLTAIPSDGWHFVRWEGDLSGDSASLAVTMSCSRILKAVFEQDENQYTLTTTVTGQGSIVPNNKTFTNGTYVTLTAKPATGWHLSRWANAAKGTDTTTQVMMTENRTVNAVFEEDAAKYTLTVTTQGEGEGSVSPSTGSYNSGAQVTLTAQAVAGSHFVQWDGDLSGTSTSATVTMNANRNITAIFEKDTSRYFILTRAIGQGTISLNPSGGAYDDGVSLTLTAAPTDGWSFLRWENSLSGTESPKTITMNSNKTIDAVFVITKPHVRIVTSKGTFVLELDRSKAPITVDNFLRYVNDGFYDGTDGGGATVFHRIMAGFMIQGGGSTAVNPTAFKTTYDPIVIESNNGLTNDKYTIAMARTQLADSATSQFFINVADNDFLNYQSDASPGYTVFGKVVEGTETIDAIAAVPTIENNGENSLPTETVTITSAKVILNP